MNIGTWNVQGIATKSEEVYKEIERSNMDIIALTETKRKGKGTEERNQYIYIYSGVPKEERASSGVILAIKKQFKKQIKSWEQINSRILQLEIEIKGHNLIIIAVYSPNDDASDDKKQDFYDELTTLLEKVTDRKEVIILGDLNGRVGSRINDPVVGQYGENAVNNNGERLIEMCHQYALKVTNSWFKHKNIHRYTWIQPTRGLKSIIDYVIVKQKTKLKVTDVRVKRGYVCGSDHFLLMANIHFPYIGNREPKPDVPIQETRITTNTYNLDSLQDDSTKFLYQLRLAAKLADVRGDTSENLYNEMKTCIHEAAHEALGEKQIYKGKKRGCHWWNEELETIVEAKRKAYTKWISTGDPTDGEDYRSKRRQVTKEVKAAKNKYWDETCEEIENSIGNTKANKAWTVIKGLRTGTKDKAGVSLISIREWQHYYQELLTENRTHLQENILDFNFEEHISVITPVTATEVRENVNKLKKGKAPGPGNIDNELIKAAPEQLMGMLAALFNKCLTGDDPPAEWKKATISSIFKKGSRKECKNYRGISVICSMARLYGRILKSRIELQINESEDQNGFRAGRSCIDGIFTVKQLVEKRLERGRSVHLTFVDLEKAYDTVPLSKLWPCMIRNGVSKPYVDAVKSLYSGCTSRVKVGKILSEEFLVNKGLRQGCSLAPLLFKIYLEEVLKNWKRKCSSMGILIGDDTLYSLLFADDQVLVAADADDSSYMLRKLFEEYDKWGLTVNTKKTEYMIVGNEEKQNLDADNCEIKHCSSFKYLGVTLSTNGKSVEDITNKIGQGRRVIRQLNSLLWNKKIANKTKRTVYKTIVESICTYGSETWELRKSDKNRLLSLEMDYWRRSAGFSKLDHIRNEEIRRIMEVEGTILDTIERKRLLWYGHLQRMDDNRWPKKIWTWSPPEKRKRGRPPRSWKTDVREAMEARNLRDGDWQDRKLWRLRSEKRQRP